MNEPHYVRLFTGTDAASHFADVVVGLTTLTNSMSHVTPFEVSDAHPVERLQFESFPPGWRSEHRAPRRQFLVFLAGCAGVRTLNGETRYFQAGDVLLAEDTSGTGHISWNLGNDTCVAAVIRLRE